MALKKVTFNYQRDLGSRNLSISLFYTNCPLTPKRILQNHTKETRRKLPLTST